jgi:CheY-like chemotaxis protein
MAAFASRQIVLVVEDEPLLRMAAANFLSDARFEALEAGDAAEAIAILESRPDIRLVFTDIHMPRGMDGLRLAALIRDRWPPVDIVLTSGYGEPSPDALPARCAFIPKPYKPEALVGALRKLAA